MQRQPAGEQELNLKKRARRRLVGAIALVLMMIIVLPMILKDRTTSTPAEKVTITLPSDEMPAAQTDSTPLDTASSDFDSSIVPTDTLPIEPAETRPAVIDETAPNTLAEDSAATKPDVAAPVKPVVEKQVAEKQTPVKQTPAKTPPVKLASSQKFYVQVGVFSDAGNVKQLQTKLGDLGYQSKTEKISTDKGQKIRLRTQTFGDRNEAAIALENIKDAGLTGMVVSQ